MIKRLIFDIDNTLITWKEEYDIVLDQILEEIHYPRTKNLYHEINDAEVEYEENRKNFDKKEMVNYINQKLNLTLPQNFVDLWLEKLPYCVPEQLEKEDYETLAYLNSKYELVALTNWFIEPQIERMKKLNIFKFFKEIYGAEKYAKPLKESFIQAAGKYKMTECAMIGDNLQTDIIGAKKAGIEKLVWKDNHGKKEEYQEKLQGIDVITKLSDLKQIF